MSESKKNQIEESDKQAWRDINAHIVFWSVFAIALAIDLISKAWVFSVLKVGERVSVIKGWFELHAIYNKGAVFGLGQGKQLIFILASVLAIIFIVQLFARTKSNQRALQILLALVLAGAVGNLYDRLMYHKVRDFMEITLTIKNVPIWPYVFNFADVILVVGVVLLMLGWITGKLDMGCECANSISCDSDSTIPIAKPLIIKDSNSKNNNS